jgi:hypothetical protein
MSWKKIRGNKINGVFDGVLTSRIGDSVNYSAPRDVSIRGGEGISGKVIGEVWATPEINFAPIHHNPCENGEHCWGNYSHCSQLIEWADGSRSIRFTYFRRRCRDSWWEPGGQHTFSESPEALKFIMEETLKQNWF